MRYGAWIELEHAFQVGKKRYVCKSGDRFCFLRLYDKTWPQKTISGLVRKYLPTHLAANFGVKMTCGYDAQVATEYLFYLG